MLCISKILKNESNSQPSVVYFVWFFCCCVSQRYWKMKAIHNNTFQVYDNETVVVYLKDTEKWKQFTTCWYTRIHNSQLLCISKILKNESNSQLHTLSGSFYVSCCVSQRYWKMKAIHNYAMISIEFAKVVVYLKDTEKWKQFTTKPFVR